MTVSTAVLAYLLTTSCEIDSEIKGLQNKVDNKIQKGLVNVDLSSTGGGNLQCVDRIRFRGI